MIGRLQESNKAYIMLSYTGTGPSVLIKAFTKEPYSHSSLSMDPYLFETYSFARKVVWCALIAGYIHEDIRTMIYAKYPKTRCCIYELELTPEQRKSLRKAVEDFDQVGDSYRYNLLGLILAPFHVYVRPKRRLYCSQYVAYMLESSGIHLFDKDYWAIRPSDFRNCDRLTKVYEGYLIDFPQPTTITP